MVMATTRIKSPIKFIWDSSEVEPKKEEVDQYAVMVVCMWVNLLMICLMDQDNQSTLTRINMLVPSYKGGDKAKPNISIARAQSIMDYGRMIAKWKDSQYYSMEMYLRDNSKIISGIMVSTITRMETPMKGFGKMMSNQVVVDSNQQMDNLIRAISKMVTNMERVSIHGR